MTYAVDQLGLKDDVVPFLTTSDPLFYLRGKNFYSEELSNGPAKAPCNTGAAAKPADDLFTRISGLMTGSRQLKTRAQQSAFYASGTMPDDTNSFVYRAGDIVSNIAYWNFHYDQAGNEGYEYASDAGGYSSNVINRHAADAAIHNGEFAPGGALLDFQPESVGPGHRNVALFTAGWGMKMAPLIGLILAQLVTEGKTPHDISRFKITRKGVLERSKRAPAIRPDSDTH